MPIVLKIILIILAVLLAILVVLYILGRKTQKKQEAQKEQMESVQQVVSMLVIDKKRLRLKESGLPAPVIAGTPFYLRRSKLPIVKAKVGPKIMTLVCDTKVFPTLPVKKEVKAVVSGIYITAIRSVRGASIETPKKKQGFLARARQKASEKVTKKNK